MKIGSEFGWLLIARTFSAFYLHITDCDETFNYWEPMHYILYGKGFQTWEYSPIFGLRSYFYLLLHAAPAWIVKELTNTGATSLFYIIRVLLATICATVEMVMFRSIRKTFGVSISNYWLLFQLFCPGMFISSTAFLPSSFSMYLTMVFLTAWWRGKVKSAIFSIVISSLIGWPFTAFLSLPFVCSTLYKHRLWYKFCFWSILTTIIVGVPLVLIDSYFYGRFTIAPLNIVLYNIFSSQGPQLFGVESKYFYVFNLFLNLNVLWCLVIVFPCLVAMATFLGKVKKTTNIIPLSHFWSTSPAFLWLAVFFMQPHKEERFLFPVYPLLTLCAAFSIFGAEKIWSIWIFPKNRNHVWRMLIFGLKTVFVALSVSRIFAMYTYYKAPMQIWSQLEFVSEEKNICIGKEWHRIPGHFFTPENMRIRFIKSHFKGILPAYYDESENGTSIVHNYFNDKNLASRFMLFEYSDCDYLIDLELEGDDRYDDIEPNYSKNVHSWKIIHSIPFIDSKKSPSIFRAFYVPYIYPIYVKLGSYNLLKKIEMNRDE